MKKQVISYLLGVGLCVCTALSGAATNGYLYYVAGALGDTGQAQPADGTLTGDNGVFSVLVADVDIAAGTVSNWRYAGNALPVAGVNPADDAYSWMFLENAVHVYNGYLYAGPGDWNNDSSRDTADVVAYAKINSDGSLQPFQLSAVFPDTPADQAISATALVDFGGGNAYYYVIAGTSSGTARVIKAKISAVDGSLGAWSVDRAISVADWFSRATAVGSTIVYAEGNLATERRSFYSVASSSDGSLGNWQDAGLYDSTASARWDYAMTTAAAGGNQFAVIMGGAPNPPTTSVHVSQVAGGVPGAWSTTNAMPVGLRRVTATAADDLIIVCGGTITNSSVANAQDAVHLGRINSSGQITWTTSPTAMPQKRAFGGAAFYRAGSAVNDWAMFD